MRKSCFHGLAFALLLTLTMLSCDQLPECENCLYCPIGTGGTHYIKLPAYLVLDSTNSPVFIEVRHKDLAESFLYRSEKVLFRAYGAQRLDMMPAWVGVEFKLYSDTLAAEPDTLFTIDVEHNSRYFEIDLN